MWLKQSEVAFFCITESRLHEGIPDNFIEILYYCLVRSDKTAASGKTSGGGILCYCHSRFNVILWPVHSVCTPDYEILTIRIKLVNTRDWYLICVYHPPEGKIKSFCDIIEVIVADLRQKPNIEITVLGDINIDIFKNDNYTKSGTKLSEMVRSQKYYQSKYSCKRFYPK